MAAFAEPSARRRGRDRRQAVERQYLRARAHPLTLATTLIVTIGVPADVDPAFAVPVGLTSRPADGANGVGDLVLGDEHEVGGVAEGNERVASGDTPDRATEAPFDKGGDDALAHPALVAGLVDDHDAADVGGVGQEIVDGQGHEPAQVEHAAADAFDA